MVKSKINDLNKLLKNYFKEEFQIVEEDITALTAPGEHYGSIILAVNLKLKSQKSENVENLNLAAKLLPANAMLRKVFDVYVTFKKEVLAYSEAIPAIVKFQEEYGILPKKFYSNLFPKCYGARINIDENLNEVDDNGVLLFENLKVQGFYTEDRLKGLDADATELILEGLARFHATPIAVKLLQPQIFEEKLKPCLVQGKGLEQVPDVLQSFHNSILEGARDCPELVSYMDKIQKICNDAMAGKRNYSENEIWKTICHSDFWTSNTMILKKNGKYFQNKIVDLQLTNYASALRDLVFFLFTSVINTVLDEHYDRFLKVYYEHFINTLKDFKTVNLEQFSWDEFNKEFEICAKREIYHILVMLKPICTERGKVKNSLEDFQDSDFTRKDLLGPNHRRKLRDTVLALHKRNLL